MKVLEHIEVYRQRGRFAGWPANHGIWAWENEILVGFSSCHVKHTEPKQVHAVDPEKPEEHLLARSRDGGESWRIEAPGDKGVLVPQGYGLHGAPPLVHEEQVYLECTHALDFSDPDFCLTVRMSGPHVGASRLYTSNNRGVDWSGPYRLPLFGRKGVAGRTDYLINGKHDCTLFLTASKNNGLEGRPFCARTKDGGRSWGFVSWIGEEPQGYCIQPSTIRLHHSVLLTAVRCKEFDRSWIDIYISEDDGYTWRLLSSPAPNTGRGNPPSLLNLNDGRIFLAYGYRKWPYEIHARLSCDAGLSWTSPYVIRTGAKNEDIGYTRAIQRPDSKVVLIYYFSYGSSLDPYIAASLLELPT